MNDRSELAFSMLAALLALYVGMLDIWVAFFLAFLLLVGYVLYKELAVGYRRGPRS